MSLMHLPPWPQVEFPERLGALFKFLRVLNPVWNISLFHYRQSGNRASTILLGLQVHPLSRHFPVFVFVLKSPHSCHTLGPSENIHCRLMHCARLLWRCILNSPST